MTKRWLKAAVFSIAAFATFGAGATVESSTNEPDPVYTNRLVDSHNPYLLLHAHNPVDWYPWGEEAFERARAEGKPIFLSVGYSTCYWCHVAERELYSDPEIAALMNEWFVNVKVDREQRPDVDRLYMLARQLISGDGGWPNNVFMTPDLEPFFAGSYFPPVDTPGRGPAFPRVLKAVHETWTADPEKVRTQARRVSSVIRQIKTRVNATADSALEPSAALAAVAESLMTRYDGRHAGFRSNVGGAKFPQSPSLNALLTHAVVTGNPISTEATTRTLYAMANGGIHDHLAGGFHRYSTDPDWSIPHFEKMLYDNAQLLEIYATAFETTADPYLGHITRRTADFIVERLSDAKGGFYTAIDAEVEGVEGESYLWTDEELDQVLGPAGRAKLTGLYEFRPMPHGMAVTGDGGVLRIRRDKSNGISPAALVARIEELDRARKLLLEQRDRRPQPRRDEKLLVDLNGLAIKSMVAAARSLSDNRYLEVAERAATRLWEQAYDPSTGELYHELVEDRAQTSGYLSDYASLAIGFHALSESPLAASDVWRGHAETLARHAVERFERIDGSYVTTPYGTELPITVPDMGDDDFPSGTSAMFELLLRLDASASTNAAWIPAARERATRRLSGRLADAPASWPVSVVALNRWGRAEEIVTTDAPLGVINTSAGRVRISSHFEPGDDGNRVVVHVEIESGYHVNANPASFDYLIPTTVRLQGVSARSVDYPSSVEFSPRFTPEVLQVYEGTPEIVIHLGPVERPPFSGTAHVQACNDEVCLPPSIVEFEVPAE